jgi:hypothetical protein
LETADALRVAYAKYLLNPETGWIAGWRSRDGQLHDYAILFVNGPALAFGLLDPAATRTALDEPRSAPRAHRRRLRRARPAVQPDPHPLRRPHAPADPQRAVFDVRKLHRWRDDADVLRLLHSRPRRPTDFAKTPRAIAKDLDESFSAGHFSGGTDSGCEFRCWDGLASGYEGSFVCSFAPMYAIAIEQGIIQPMDPEWWPASGA